MHFCPQEMMVIMAAFDPAMAIFVNVACRRFFGQVTSLIKG